MTTKIHGTTGVEYGGINVTGPPNRNVIDNGEMQINQRGTVASITSSQYAGPDRWKANLNAGTWTVSGETDSPTGFTNSYKILCTTANSSLSAGSIVQIYQAIEGQNLQRFKKGTADALQFAVSFWVKSNVTGTYIAELHDNDNSRCVSASYTISSSATWEKKTITFPADSTGAFDTNNGDSFKIYFKLAAGTNFTSGTLQTSAWIAQDNTKRAAGQVNLAAATNNYWQVTGVQIEAGSTNTEFEHQTINDSMVRCQRYLRVYGGHAAYQRIGIGYFSNNDRIECPLPLAPQMRTTPTMSVSNAGHWKAESPSGSGEFTAVGLDGNSSNQVAIVWGDKSGTFTGGESGRYLADNTTDARIYLSSEL